MSASGSTRLSLGFSLLLVVVIALLSLYFIDFEEVGWQLRQADTRYLALAGLMLLGGFVIHSLRWRNLLKRQTSIAETFHATNLGNLVNMILPMNPGDALRIWFVNRSSAIGVGQGTSSIVIERLFENIMRLLALSGMLVFGTGFINSTLSVVIGLAGFLGVILTVLIWMIKNRQRVLQSWPRILGRLPRLKQESVHQMLAELLDSLVAMSSPRQIAAATLNSFLAWGLFFGFHYFTLQALNFSISQQQMLALSLGTLMMIPPSSPALPGVFHAQIVLPFAALGISSSHLIAYAIVLHALEAGIILSLGLLALLFSGISLGDLLSRRGIAPAPVVAQLYSGD